MNTHVFFCPPPRTLMGRGCRHELPALIAHLGWRRGLVITDRFFTTQTRWVEDHINACKKQGIEIVVFDGGQPDPSTTLCDQATQHVRAHLAEQPIDYVLAMGGGSNIDLAKALCLTVPTGQTIRAYSGTWPAHTRPLPLIALPTTSGTGSEATPGAILVDPDNATKIAVMGNALRPAIAVIDPELSDSCPPRVTADAGIDALTHAIESFVTQDASLFDRGGSPDPGYSGRSGLTMMFAREAIRLCGHYMLRAYRDGTDTEARDGMASASYYAALSYGTAGLNAVHGIAYALAGLTHQSHGTTNAVLLPYVLDELRETRAPELREVAQLLGMPTDQTEDAVLALPAYVRSLIEQLGIPTDLRQCGVQEHQLEGLLHDALQVTRLAKAFPVADRTSAYQRIIRHAFEGSLATHFILN
ncbi:iron-containing alcohol dehydrogenase [Alcaligenes faecalis]|uniref:Iron-containing alcohol dehydrogenase n=3 Tax=Alcaligenes ammonioxydans TaxID=2582914 RepID=A0ABX8SXY9_9BURK|nr:iron-containing alcohol dehydrogenase [Alcaligenes ammonioxydans]QBH18693.1 iron-containing alcohol dehydrogenase [Alcaligenes faecalis]QXX79798.1 iron-containing alcohol dehydrogenase [Alcaligenes ammonioxydans]